MNKAELSEIIAATHGLSKTRAQAIIDTIFNVIEQSVANGDPVRLIGFGTFEAVDGPERKGYNRYDGVAVPIRAKRRPKFVPGKRFRDKVDGVTHAEAHSNAAPD